MKKLKSIIFSIALMLPFFSFGQVITSIPATPTDLNSVEITFDAALGNAGLVGYTGTVYAHMGVITNLSSGGGDWKHVIAGWSYNSDSCKMTSLGNNKWKLVISPTIRLFYHVPAGETILKLAFVFRSSDGSKTGKTAAGGDLFYDVAPSSLSVQITAPSSKFVFAQVGQPVSVSVTSAFADVTNLYDGNLLIGTTTGTTLTKTITPICAGKVKVRAEALQGTKTVVDSFYYYVTPSVTMQDPPAGTKPGINYIDDNTTILCLYAPNKSFAFVIGDFNNWSPEDAQYMKKSTDGKRFWLQLGGLVKGQEYGFQYLVNGIIRIPDPYTDKVLDPWNDSYIPAATYPNLKPYPNGKTTGLVSVLQTGQTAFNWQVTNFSAPKQEKPVIYELLVRDFTDTHNYAGVTGKLDYLKNLGINVLELMPVNEFDGNLSWGYNPALYFAPDKYYGTKNELKQLVDGCHSRGIAVVIDLVLNHSYGNSPFVQLYWDPVGSCPSAENPWYNQHSNFENPSAQWGYDFNHESSNTRQLVDSINSYWMKEYKVDGFRFDFTKGFSNTPYVGLSNWGSNYDAARISNLKRMANEIWKRNPKAYVILEHLADNSEETELANNGMLLWGNLNGVYAEAAMGYNDSNKSSLSWASYANRGWNKPNAVVYMESHDEERQTYKTLTYGNSSGTYNTKDLATALNRAALTAAFFFTIPGPKMIWQFEELGYDYSINYCADGTVNNNCRVDAKPVKWDYFTVMDRWRLNQIYTALIKLKLNDSILDAKSFDMDVASALKRIRLQNSEKSAVALGNFDVVSGSITPNFFNTGKWYEFYKGDSITITDVTAPITLQPGEYRLYLSKRVKNTLGVEDETDRKGLVTVYPNPVTEQCKINIHYPGKANCMVQVYTLQGIEKEVLYNGILTNDLELLWPPKTKGMYLLRVRLGSGDIVKKIIVI